MGTLVLTLPSHSTLGEPHSFCFFLGYRKKTRSKPAVKGQASTRPQELLPSSPHTLPPLWTSWPPNAELIVHTHTHTHTHTHSNNKTKKQKMRNFRKFLNVVWNLLVNVLSVSLLNPCEIPCLPVWKSSLCLNPKPISTPSCTDRLSQTVSHLVDYLSRLFLCA